MHTSIANHILYAYTSIALSSLPLYDCLMLYKCPRRGIWKKPTQARIYKCNHAVLILYECLSYTAPTTLYS